MRPTPQSLKLWDLSRGGWQQSIAVDLSTVERGTLPVAVSPDRRLLAFPRRVYDDRIEVWNISEGRLISTLELEKPAGILALAFSLDGRQLVISLGQRPPVSIWDLASARRIRMLDTPERVHQLYWTTQDPDGPVVAGQEALSPRDGTVQHTLQLGSPGPSSPNRPMLPMAPSALSGDGNTLAVHVPDHGIGVWRVGQAH
ncbi:WD40 repeat domain-containing protein [Cyanobium sp. ATX 6A2]|nr:WD40 repeat domain-containing protein [Cyanobium sp. ATX 6A2]